MMYEYSMFCVRNELKYCDVTDFFEERKKESFVYTHTYIYDCDILPSSFKIEKQIGIKSRQPCSFISK
jgi:hypothetical protein